MTVDMTIRRSIITAWIAFIAALAFAQPPEITDHIAQVARGDYDRAIVGLYPLADQYPDDGLLQYWLGRAYYGQRHFHLAARALGVAVERDGQNRDALLWYARALRASGMAKKAVEAYASYRMRCSTDDTILKEYAVVRAQAGDYRGALETLSLLAAHDHSAATQQLVTEWQSMLAGVSSSTRLEPSARYQAAHFTVLFDPENMRVMRDIDAVESARAKISEETGITITRFRVLLFTEWSHYQRYARLWLPNDRQVYAPAFTLPDALILWEPENWRKTKYRDADLPATLRHEMAHLALAQRTGDQGIPLWLNEGLACYYSGSAGIRTGQPPATPFSVLALDDALTSGEISRQEQAYAQAHAMASVMVEKLGIAGIRKLLDLLASGMPLSVAYQRAGEESFEAFLADWPLRFAALPRGNQR